MKEQKGFTIALNSRVPFIQAYDKLHNTGFGKFFDEFERIDCHCTLSTPSENKVMFGSTEPFFVTSINGYLHKYVAGYEGVGTHGESIVGVTEKFVKQIFEKCDQGYYVSVGTDSDKLHKLVVSEADVRLEPYKKE